MKYSMFTGFSENVKAHGIEKAIALAKESGFSAGEFYFSAGMPELIPTREIGEKYKMASDAADFPIPCVSIGATFIRTPDGTPSEADVEALFKALEFTKALGAKYLHHTIFMGFHFPIDEGFINEKNIEVFYSAANRVADRAAELGITVLYEPQGPIFNGLERFSALIDKMRRTHDNIGICCDVANSYWVSEEPHPIFEKYPELIRHVHFKDYLIYDRETEGASKAFFGSTYTAPAPIGQGDIDIPRVVRLLRSINYTGFISIEDHANIKSPELTRNIIDYCEELFK